MLLYYYIYLLVSSLFLFLLYNIIIDCNIKLISHIYVNLHILNVSYTSIEKSKKYINIVTYNNVNV